jgi:Ca2+-binding EF-hand superfamily protein
VQTLKNEVFVQIRTQFDAADKDGDGRLSRHEFGRCMGVLGGAPQSGDMSWYARGLSDFLFDGIDSNGDGLLTFSEYLIAMAIMLNGSAEEKLRFAFNMIDRDNDGFIDRAELTTIVSAMLELLEKMGLRVHRQTHTPALVERVFARLDARGTGRIAAADYVAGAPQCSDLLRSLGFLDDAELYAMSRTVSSASSSPPSSGVSVGHARFETVAMLMFGLRLSIQRAYDRAGSKHAVPLRDGDTSDEAVIPLYMGAPSTASVNPDASVRYVDFAPNVFKQLRVLAGVDDRLYMLSLGPEQLFGSLMLGSLGTLSVKVSDGKSGSFFFSSVDQRFFLKTISSSERRCMQRVVGSWHEHMVRCRGSTLLNQFLSFGQLQMPGQLSPTAFVAMSNAFHDAVAQGFDIKRVYDLKGSTKGRSNPSDSGPKKDLDFLASEKTIRVGAERRADLLARIRADVAFLERIGVIDYSLLLGIGERTVNATPQRAFFFAIIDTLTAFGTKKGGEFLLRSLVASSGNDNFSCKPPAEYATRFIQFIEHILE